MEKQPRLLCSVLCVQRRPYEVILNCAILAWKETQTTKKQAGRAIYGTVKAGSHCVPVCEIIAVQENDDDCPSKYSGKWQKVPQSPVDSQQHAFTVTYVERTRQHCWRCSDVTFHCPERALCLLWVETIKEQLALLTNRPKHLLVYINPYGGKQRGKQIYDHKVAPIFSRASISTNVIVTEHANHAKDHLKTEADLKKYDGVVCVGGDGMFSEIMHGFVSRTQCDKGVDENSMEETLVPCGLRIGIIPAGWTTTDVHTFFQRKLDPSLTQPGGSFSKWKRHRRAVCRPAPTSQTERNPSGLANNLARCSICFHLLSDNDMKVTTEMCIQN